MKNEELENPIDDDLLRELGLESSSDRGADDEFQAPADDLDLFSDLKTDSEATQIRPTSSDDFDDDSVDEVLNDDVDDNSDEEFSQQVQSTYSEPSEEKKGLWRTIENMPVDLVGVIGQKKFTLKEVASLEKGNLIEFNKNPGELIELVVKGKVIGLGELVLIDGRMGVQIKEIF